MEITTWTWQELVTEAGGHARAERLQREKQVWRVMRGVYVGAEHADTPEVRLAALDRVVPEHAVLCGRTALWALGLDLGDVPEPVEIAVPRGKHLRKRPGVVARAMQTTPAELVVAGGRHAVSPSRAVVDVARAEGLVEGVALGDAVLRSGLTTMPLVEASLARARGLRGVEGARQIVAHLEPRSESPMESRLRMVLVQGGIPRPEAQVDFYSGWSHAGRADIYLEGVAFEYDGFAVHDRKTAFTRDRRRGNDFANGGIVVCRFTADDYYKRAHPAIVSTARRALEEARGRTVRLRRGPDTLRPPALRPPPTLLDLAPRAA